MQRFETHNELRAAFFSLREKERMREQFNDTLTSVLLPSETVSQSDVRPSTGSGRTGKYLNLRSANTVRGEALEP